MRLGIVGMLPGDFRTFTTSHMQAIRDLEFTGFGFHLNGDDLFDISVADCEAYHRFMLGEHLDLAQFAITYDECLFHPDAAIRDVVTKKIDRGTEIAAQLGAQCFLLRPGSLNPNGPWTPHRDNGRPENIDRLIETLKPIAAKAEEENVLLALETHVLSIMDPPEQCHQIIAAVGSDRLQLIMDAVNHFSSLKQVYNSTDFINHVFDVTGSISPVAHLKDIKMSNGLVLQIDQEVPGEGLLDIPLMLERFDALYPDGYGLIEHLSIEKIPIANRNIRRLAAARGVEIH
jgi:sugar phosphate isomerase/epimerase